MFKPAALFCTPGKGTKPMFKPMHSPNNNGSVLLLKP